MYTYYTHIYIRAYIYAYTRVYTGKKRILKPYNALKTVKPYNYPSGTQKRNSEPKKCLKSNVTTLYHIAIYSRIHKIDCEHYNNNKNTFPPNCSRKQNKLAYHKEKKNNKASTNRHLLFLKKKKRKNFLKKRKKEN